MFFNFPIHKLDINSEFFDFLDRFLDFYLSWDIPPFWLYFILFHLALDGPS